MLGYTNPMTPEALRDSKVHPVGMGLGDPPPSVRNEDGKARARI